MKTLVGVDSDGSYQLAVELCGRLQFPSQNWVLVNAVPLPLAFAPGIYFDAAPMADAMQYWRNISADALDEAEDLIVSQPVNSHSLDGDATAVILRMADENHVDLIAVGSGKPEHGVVWFVGSVSRALSYGASQSLLVAKPRNRKSGPVSVVFATDHSDYAKRAAEKFIQWNPGGIERIDIVTAYELQHKTMMMALSGQEVDPELDEHIEEHALRECESLAAKFKTIAKDVRVSVTNGKPNDVIREAMNDSNADLLILGAQGHGFIDRLLVGSTSLHQLVGEPYSVLVIRV